ncbi:MAG TPA: ankyrin repeat domain-containing protein [Terriglobia bacterium]|nr:ankyrin repeat domain-containing protein [Terriglobia bacterium]
MTRRLILLTTVTVLACIASLTLAAGKSAVADAVQKGDNAALRALLVVKTDVNAAQVDGTTALHWAVYRNEATVVDQLLKAGAKVGAKNREGITPLYMAAIYGDPTIVGALLKAGANAKEPGPNGETTLMLAARNGNPAVVKQLIGAGVDLNTKEPLRGTTALMWAAEQSHPEAVKALLDAGADWKIRSSAAGTSRPYVTGAVSSNGVNAAKNRIRTQLETGVSIEDQIKAAAAAGGGGRGRGAGQDQAAAAAGNQGRGGNNARGGNQGRGGQGGNQNRGGQGGNQARGGARGTGTAANADAPADDQAEAEDQAAPEAGLQGAGGGGLTALIFAARQGDLESAKYLLAAGADVNQTTAGGWTPLLTATNNRHYVLGKYLVEHGANVNLANGKNFTPLYLATDNRNIEGGDYPVPKPDMDHLDYIRFLLEKGANPNAKVSDNTETRTIFTNQWFFEPGTTPFVRAAQSGDLELMKLLLAHGADPKIANDFGDTALSAVAGIGWVEGVTYEHSPAESLEAAKLLLDLGLSPNSQNRDLRTPLMGAAHKGRNEMIQLFVDRGGMLDMRDKGSRDTHNANNVIAGHQWIALDYADGLVRVGVQSANPHPETANLIRKLMGERGMFVPPPNRDFNSICIVDICQERKPEFLEK